MSAGPRIAIACACAVLGACVATARPAPGAPAHRVWQPQQVRWPVHLDQVEPAAPWVPASARDTGRPVEVDGARAAALWLGPAEVVRVRVIGGGDGHALSLHRVIGDDGARGVISEPGVPVAGGVALVEPAGAGAVWVIGAAAATTIVVERTAPRRPRLAWELARREVLGWIDRPGAPPALPDDDDGAAALRLRAGAAVVAALGEVTAPVAAGLRAWRRAEAEALLLADRPAGDPYVARDALVGRRAEVDGPALLVVDARAVAPTGGAWDPLDRVHLVVRRDGALAASVRAPAAPPRLVRAAGAAFPSPAAGPLGRRIRAQVVVPPGRHRIEIDAGDGRLVHAELRRRRLRLRDVVGWLDETEAARDALGDAPRGAAALADALLAAVRGEPAAAVDLSGVPDELALLAELVAAPALLDPEPAIALVTRVAAVARAPGLDADLRATLVLELARRLPDGVDATALADAVLAAPLPAPAVLAALAPHLHGADAIAAAALAWRQASSDPASRAALLAADAGASWQTLEAGDAVPTRWLFAGAAEHARGLVELTPGADAALVAAPAADDPARLSLLRFHVVAPAEAPGPITIGLDDAAYHLLATAPVELVAIAAAPGAHRARIDAPPGTRAWVAVPGMTGTARIRRFWPLATAQGPTVFELPAGYTGALRVELRALQRDAGAQTVMVHSDASTPRRITVTLRSDDAAAWPLDLGAALSRPLVVELPVPPGATRIWLVADDGAPLVAQLGVRSASASAPALASASASASVPAPASASAPAAPHDGDPLRRLHELSTALVAAPARPELLLARAHLLIALGAIRSARQDLAAARRAGADRALLAALAAELSGSVDPSHLPVQPPGSPLVDGALLWPALAAVAPDAASLEPLLPLVRALRARGADDTWQRLAGGELTTGDDAVAQALRAHIATLAGQRADAAATLLPLHGTWQAALAALDVTDDAPLAFGLAAELDAVALPRVRRARLVAARGSRWQPVRATEQSAGHERLAVSPGEPEPAVALRHALLAVPWPIESVHLLDPGEAAVLAVDGPRTIRAEAWCRRPGLAERPCDVTVTLDQAAPRPRPAPAAEVATLDEVAVPAGRHQLEVMVGDDPGAVVAVRFSDDDGAIAPVRPGRWFLARPARPIEIVVAGPATVAIEVRGYQAPHGAVTVELDDGLARTLTLDDAPAPEVAPSRGVTLTRAVTTVALLAQAGPHRVTVRPSSGAIAVRLAVRVPGAPGAEADPELDDEPAARDAVGLAWPAGPSAGIAATTPERPLGLAPSVELLLGQDDLGELDDDLAALGLRAELAVQVRRRLGRLWLLGEVRGRRAGALAPTGLTRFAAELRGLPHRLAADLELRGAAEPIDGVGAWTASAAAAIEHRRSLGGLELAPGLALIAAAGGPDPAPSPVDPVAASQYRRDHPLQLTARVTARWRPLVDQVTSLRIEARSNADLRSVDQIGAAATWSGLVELWPLRGPIASLSYRPGVRFADDDRADRLWRNDFGARLDWTVAGPLTLSLRGDLYLTAGRGEAHALRLVARWDLGGGGRRLRLPSEQQLDDFVMRTAWADQR